MQLRLPPWPSSTTIQWTALSRSSCTAGPAASAIRSGIRNLLANLGLPDADAHILKAELFAHFDPIVQQSGITQVEAERLLGLSQPGIPIIAPSSDVDIVIRQSRSAAGGRLCVAASETA